MIKQFYNTLIESFDYNLYYYSERMNSTMNFTFQISILQKHNSIKINCLSTSRNCNLERNVNLIRIIMRKYQINS